MPRIYKNVKAKVIYFDGLVEDYEGELIFRKDKLSFSLSADGFTWNYVGRESGKGLYPFKHTGHEFKCEGILCDIPLSRIMLGYLVENNDKAMIYIELT